jgi:hypothetical protein
MYVHSYPRSGTHYLTAVLETNFGAAAWWREDAHQLPGDLGTGHRHFYIHRNFEDVARSFLARDRNSTEFEVFQTTPWVELFNLGYLRDSPRRKEWIVSEHRNLTPYEFWELHVASWSNAAASRNDVYLVAYEDLMQDFHSTLLKMSQWLGSDKVTFKNVVKKVDPAPVREGGFRAPE